MFCIISVKPTENGIHIRSQWVLFWVYECVLDKFIGQLTCHSLLDSGFYFSLHMVYYVLSLLIALVSSLSFAFHKSDSRNLNLEKCISFFNDCFLGRGHMLSVCFLPLSLVLHWAAFTHLQCVPRMNCLMQQKSYALNIWPILISKDY